MEHFVAYHSVKQMGHTLEPGGSLHFLSRKHGLLRKALGNTVWIVQGLPDGKRTNYSIQGAYIAESLEEVDDEPGLFSIRGTTGVDFQPPIQLNNLEWFSALQKTQSNFSLGFNRISDDRVVAALIGLREGQASLAATEELYDIDLQDSAIEGAPRLVIHLRRERSRRLVEAKKAAVLASEATLTCEVCNFDFSKKYGSWGAGFCEVHHKVPIAMSDSSAPTRLEDLAILCSNCHRIIHRVDPMPSVEVLSAHVRKEST